MRCTDNNDSLIRNVRENGNDSQKVTAQFDSPDQQLSQLGQLVARCDVQNEKPQTIISLYRGSRG
eukprot:1193672-Prorocentrum_minimum.AAC.1